MNRRAVVAAAVFLFAVAVVLLRPRPAGAQGLPIPIPGLPSPGDVADKATCRAAPDPATPDGGMMGFLVEPPGNPWNGNPWDPNSGGSIRDKYGYGGLEFVTYDQGCPGQIQSYAPNFLENLVWKAPIYLTAFADQVTHTMMNPEFLGVFDPVVTNTSRSIREGPFAVFLPLTFAAVGLWVVCRAFGRNRSVSEALSAGLWLIAVVGVAGLFVAQPLLSVRLFDEQASGVTQAIGSGFGGSENLIGQIHKEILYETWLTGTFGDATAPVAQRRGPELFEAGVYSWAEWQGMRSGAVNAADLKRSKQDRWQEVAEQVKNEDPIAYEHLQGNHIKDRWPRSLFATVGVAGATLFQVLAGFAYVIAMLAARFFVLAWPVAVILGAFPSKRGVLLGLWQFLVGTFLSALACLFAAGLVSVMVGAILASTELAGWLVLFLLLAVFVAAWMLLRPYRSFAGGHVGSAARKAGKAIVAVKLGEHMVEKGTEDAEANRQRKPSDRKPPGEAPVTPPPRERRTAPTDMPTGFTRPVDSRDPQLPAYRPAVGAGNGPAALGAGKSKAWEPGGPRVRVEEPVASAAGPRQRVDSTTRTAPNPPDRVSRAAQVRVRSDAGPPIDTTVRRDREGREVYVPVARRKVKETV